MQNFFREHWFKTGILILLLLGIGSAIYYFFIFQPQLDARLLTLQSQHATTTGAEQKNQPATILNKPSAALIAQKQQANIAQLAQASQVLSNQKIIAKVKPAVVYIETGTELGSGFIVESDGYILTNAHVVTGATVVNVTLSDGTKYAGTVVGRDENVDVALIKIDAANLPTETLGNSDNVQQGDNVFTFGYPFGIAGDVDFKNGTVSRHILSNGINYIEISAQIEPGNSGGPLVNEAGAVVGINTFMYGQSVAGVSVGESLKFAMPINTAKSLLPSLESGTNTLKPQVTKESGYQVCSDTYSYQTWDGTYTSDGKYNCVCDTGYTWSPALQYCVYSAPTNTAPSPTQNDETIGDNYYITNHTCAGLSGDQYGYCVSYAYNH